VPLLDAFGKPLDGSRPRHKHPLLGALRYTSTLLGENAASFHAASSRPYSQRSYYRTKTCIHKAVRVASCVH
jgi:hypothetical protein